MRCRVSDDDSVLRRIWDHIAAAPPLWDEAWDVRSGQELFDRVHRVGRATGMGMVADHAPRAPVLIGARHSCKSARLGRCTKLTGDTLAGVFVAGAAALMSRACRCATLCEGGAPP